MTAVAVCTDPPLSPAWHAARALGIGGSDIGTLLGYNPWATPLDLWRIKTGDADGFDGNFASRRGQHLESFLIAEYERATPGTYVETVADGMPSMVALEIDSIVRCSLDGIAHDRHGDHVVEVKTAGSRQSVKWAGGALPDAYTAQVVWQLGITGLDRAVVVADLAGDFTVREVLADPDVFARMVDYAQVWWDRHVVGGVMPDPDPVRDAAALSGLWTPDPDRAVELDPDLVDGLWVARNAYTAAKTDLEVAQARVQCAMTTATTATVDGQQVARWAAVKPRVSVDVAALKADGLFDKYSRRGDPSRRFTITNQGDQG